MNATASQLKKLVSVFSALLVVVGIGLVGQSVEPTEATWADQVHGESAFGLGNLYEGQNWAHATAGYGEINRSLTRGSLNTYMSHAVGDGGHDLRDQAFVDNGLLGIVRGAGYGYSCARSSAPSLLRSCATLPLGPSPISYAASSLRDFRISVDLLGLLPRLRYGTGGSGAAASVPAIARAECRPGERGEASLVSADPKVSAGPILVGPATEYKALPIPPANSETSVQLDGTLGIYTYKATLQHVQVAEIGHAKTQLRLKVEARGNITEWDTHVILAHAECGASFRPIAPPTMPQVGQWPALTETAPKVASAPRNLPPDIEGEVAAASEVELVGPNSSVPSTSGGPAATTPVTTESVEPTVPTTATAGPEDPQPVRVGREFTVVNREGVELGTARIDDVVRTQGCGVELTLSIRTSAEAGPDRWASIGPGDFAEVRPSGSIRRAGTVSSDCDQAANSRDTALSAGRDYEVVIAVALDDSAQQALLRPDGTAGWVVDLPPLPKVTATTSPSAPTPTSSPTTASGEPSVETSVNTAAA